MWKWLHPYAKAQASYELAGKLIPWFVTVCVASFAVGLVWGLVFAPADYQQGDSFRIIYIHVPAAILSMAVYTSMAVAAFIGLVWQLRLSDMAVAAMAPVGAVFTFIALFTGAAWGKPMWGAWWVWDARLTAELILLFLYLGVIALYNAFSDKALAGRAAGILTLVGVINIPIIHYSVEWWTSIHQGPSLVKMDTPSIAGEMLWPLLVMIVAYQLLFFAIVLTGIRSELLQREKGSRWVNDLLTTGVIGEGAR